MNGDDAIKEIYMDVKELRKDLSFISTQGCAKREGDLSRIHYVEQSLLNLGNKMDKIFYATLVTAGGIIVFLVKALWPLIIKI